jgi:hypothetical protein
MARSIVCQSRLSRAGLRRRVAPVQRRVVGVGEGCCAVDLGVNGAD